ncbi:MAG: hypothetical protein J5I93_04570 [Pirellulaceae bacterium]|nr:hypothetical protein [Pirellulaceae bacterium]
MHLEFEAPGMWLWAVPLALAALGLFGWSLAARGYAIRRVLILVALRGLTGVLLLLLLARPVWVAQRDEEPRQRKVVVLLDRSASMSLTEGGQSRYGQAVEFLRDRLLPELKGRELRTEAMLFAEEAEDADGARVSSARPDGQQTDLAAAIVHAVGSRQPPPLAIVALTDGAVTRTELNRRAVSALVDNGIPLIAVGFGSETGSNVLSLERIDAPATTAAEQQFQIAVQLQATGQGALPPFDLVLTRNGLFVERRRIEAVTAPRYWQESFEVTEADEGLVSFSVRLLPPNDPAIVCPSQELSAGVRVTEERDLRVLFVQGGLTWDYKFVRLAVGSDPSIRLSALSRSANRSSMFQNIQGDADLVGGFPSSLQQLARYRVIVLSNLGPADLNEAQQQLLDRFCGEFAGGVLLMGGTDTINANWQGTRLEQLLPVTVAPGGQASSQAGVRVRLTEAALRHPVLQIADDGNTTAAWSRLPQFTGFARVQGVKPGAEVWLEAAGNPASRQPLMVVQRYGRGVSAVLCLQNFWRWRLAKEVDTAQFDRFWRQLLRFLSEGSRDTLWLAIPNQPLEPDRDLRVELELRPDPEAKTAGTAGFALQVLDPQQREVSRQNIQLRSGQTSELTFRTTEAGLHQLNVLDANQVVRASRSVEIRRVPYEFINTSRDIENLRQWARLSGGMATKVEDCLDASQLVDRLSESLEQLHQQRPRSLPAAVNGWVLLCVLAGVCGEWFLRKRWGLA